MIFYFGIASSQTKENLMEVEKINQYSELIDKDSYTKRNVFQINGKEKNITYTYWKKGNEIVKISREWKQNNGQFIDTYTEYFLLKNEERVYANQSIIFNNKLDKEIMGGWSCIFWFHKNKVIHTTSLGHGKTEDDSWDYEKEMKENFDYMMKQVQKIEKEKKK